jgi:putative ABC transport system permease protein
MSGLRVILSRCSALFRRPALDRELDDELRAHLEMAAEEHRRRGMSAEEARQAALREFGGVTQVRERVRLREGWPLLENLRRDVGYAFRQMRRAPGFAVVVLLTLALGIGATTAIFTLVYSTLLRPLPYPQADRIVALHDVRLQGQSTGGLMGVPRFFDLRARSRSFAALGLFYFDHPTLIVGKQLPVAVQAVGANADFWKVFEVRPLLGRTFDERDDAPNVPDAVVLSYGGWQKFFAGDPHAVGRQITLEQKAATVVGVMPQSFTVPSGIDLWRPAHFVPGNWTTYRGEGTRFVNVYGRLRPGVSLAEAQNDLRRIGEQLEREYPGSDGVWQFSSDSLRQERYGNLRPALMILLMASDLLLLIACINVANLLLSRATARQREVALRRALGASAARMAAQFLTESAVLGLLGGAAGVASALALVYAVAPSLPGRLGLPGAVTMNRTVALISLAVSLATGIAFGLAPVLEGGRVELNMAMKRGETRLGGAGGNKLRSVLVAMQVGLSLVLLVGATLLGTSLWRLVNRQLGFEPDHLLMFSVSLPWNASASATKNLYVGVQQGLEALPGVTAVGQIDAPPTVDWHLRSNYDADWLPRTAGQPAINAEVRSIGGNYAGAMRIPLLAGRMFDAADMNAKVAPLMVNEALVQRYLPQGNPVGRHLLLGSEAHEIVGVLANVRGTAGPLAAAAGPEVYWPSEWHGGVPNRYFVVRTTTSPELTIRAVREVVHAVDPLQGIGHVTTMDQLLDEAVAQPRLNMWVVAAFAGIALVLACVGIYGVVSFFVAQGTQEIGVRMALGASRRGIAQLFIRRALTPAAAGLIAGTLVALGLMRLVQSQLYGVRADDPWVYAASVLALLVPVLLATLRPAWKAASVDPVEALRTE